MRRGIESLDKNTNLNSNIVFLISGIIIIIHLFFVITVYIYIIHETKNY